MTGAATRPWQDEAFARIGCCVRPISGPSAIPCCCSASGPPGAGGSADLGNAARPAIAPLRRTVEREVEAVRSGGTACSRPARLPALLARRRGAADPDAARRSGAGGKALCRHGRPRNASAAAVKLARDFPRARGAGSQWFRAWRAGSMGGAWGALPHRRRHREAGSISPIRRSMPICRNGSPARTHLAEQPPGTEPRGSHFPSRNRIIAGLAGRAGGGSGGQVGQPHHRAARGRGGARGHGNGGNPRRSARAAQPRLPHWPPIREGAVLVPGTGEVVELLSTFAGEPRSTFRGPPFGFDYTPDDIAGGRARRYRRTARRPRWGSTN